MPSREIIIVKREQIMTDLLGHSNIFATLSLSLSLSQVLNRQSTFIKIRARACKYKAFHAEMYGKPHCFFPNGLQILYHSKNSYYNEESVHETDGEGGCPPRTAAAAHGERRDFRLRQVEWRL